jgi:hypothetical protein
VWHKMCRGKLLSPIKRKSSSLPLSNASTKLHKGSWRNPTSPWRIYRNRKLRDFLGQIHANWHSAVLRRRPRERWMVGPHFQKRPNIW